MTSTSPGRALRLAQWLVTALVRLYPSGFREEFGPSVRELVARELAAASRNGFLALARVAASHSIDIGVSAMRQRLSPLVSVARGDDRPDGVFGAWSGWLRDSKYGARLLAKHRAFSAVVVITLALAIGANTVIFAFTNILLLKPLPVRDPETLGWIFSVGPQAEGNRSRSSIEDFLDFRTSATSFTALAGWRRGTLTLTQSDGATRVNSLEVTANLLDVWGLTPRTGRLFDAGADALGAPPVVVLSHQFWVRRYGSDPSVVGRSLMLDGVGRTVLGVLEPAIEIGNLSTVDIWAPVSLDLRGAARDDRRLSIVGRLASGVTVEQANAEIHTIAKRLQQEHPSTNNGWDARVATSREATAGPSVWAVLALLGLIVSFILLIACANLANVMLARATDRAREIAIRTALGAGRRTIVRQLVIESLLLGAVGGAAGLLLGYGGIALIKATAYEEFFALLSIDRNVVVFVTALTILTSILFSVVPAIHISRTDVAEVLKGTSRSASGGRRVRRGRAALVVSQLTLALSLAFVAVLVVRSMIAMARIDLGFDTHELFTFNVDLPAARYGNDTELPIFYEKTLSELRSLGGVRAVAVANRIPVIGGESPGPVTVDGRVVARPADQPWATSTKASPTFFEAAGIAMLAGRAFSRDDNTERLPVAIVNREMAKRHWGSPEAAVGKRVAFGGAGSVPRWLTIVGVSGDTKPADITLATSPQIYVPIAQQPARTTAFLIRSAKPGQLATQVRAAVRRVDPGIAVYDARTMDESLAIDMSSNYVLTGMYTAFAVIALSLAAAGLYGVMSYSVSQRTREMGIRVALGATAFEVQRMVLAQGGRLLLIGTVLGILGGTAIATAIRSLLYGVTPSDPVTYASVSALMVVVMGVATYIPARRAMSVDPVRALRAE